MFLFPSAAEQIPAIQGPEGSSLQSQSSPWADGENRELTSFSVAPSPTTCELAQQEVDWISPESGCSGRRDRSG